MEQPLPYLLAGLAGLAAGLAPFIVYRLKIRRASRTAEEILARSERESQDLRDKAAKKLDSELHDTRAKADKDLQAKREELLGLEKRLAKKEDSLDRKFDLLNKKEAYLETRE